MAYLFLVVAIVFEVAGTLSLRMATVGGVRGRLWICGVAVGYLVAFTGLTLALAEGLALGVAYGIWAAAGVALMAVLGRILFKEALTRMMGLGIGLIIVGVLLIELGAAH